MGVAGAAWHQKILRPNLQKWSWTNSLMFSSCRLSRSRSMGKWSGSWQRRREMLLEIERLRIWKVVQGRKADINLRDNQAEQDRRAYEGSSRGLNAVWGPEEWGMLKGSRFRNKNESPAYHIGDFPSKESPLAKERLKEPQEYKKKCENENLFTCFS